MKLTKYIFDDDLYRNDEDGLPLIKKKKRKLKLEDEENPRLLSYFFIFIRCRFCFLLFVVIDNSMLFSMRTAVAVVIIHVDTTLFNSFGLKLMKVFICYYFPVFVLFYFSVAAFSVLRARD